MHTTHTSRSQSRGGSHISHEENTKSLQLEIDRFCRRLRRERRRRTPSNSNPSSKDNEDGETLKTYSDRYWEMFNEIDWDFDDVAIRTFKADLQPSMI